MGAIFDTVEQKLGKILNTMEGGVEGTFNPMIEHIHKTPRIRNLKPNDGDIIIEWLSRMRPIDSRQGCQNTFLMMTLKIVNNLTIDCGCAQSKLTSMKCMPLRLCVKFLCVKLTNYVILIDVSAIRNQFTLFWTLKVQYVISEPCFQTKNHLTNLSWLHVTENYTRSLRCYFHLGTRCCLHYMWCTWLWIKTSKQMRVIMN